MGIPPALPGRRAVFDSSRIIEEPPRDEPLKAHCEEVGMNPTQSLSHAKWECKYHIVWIPKCRRKRLFGQLRSGLGPVFHDLAHQKESEILEGHLLPDHVHMLIAIPPKYAVAQVIGYIKGKSAIWIARTYGGRQRNFTGEHFWARGYYVSTVGRDERAIRAYIQQQEKDDARLEQLNMFGQETTPDGL